MSPFSYFFSSIQTSDRIATLRDAEKHLFDFAKTRFAHVLGQDESNHHFELFDTPIAAPSVINGADGSVATCQVRGETPAAAGGCYSLHGVKVVNKQLSSGKGGPSDSAAAPEKQAPLVLLHGYANGSLYFYRNLMGLSYYFSNIYALDLLGWGLSSRPKFDLRPMPLTHDNDSAVSGKDESVVPLETRQKVSSAESFFVESLESWRRQHGLSKLILAGHSMGGYISVAYAERYPERVERLILLSPVGVPKRRPEDDDRINNLPFHIRAMFKTVRYMFNSGFTPGAFLRSLPLYKSKQMVDGYILNRLPAISCPEERKHLGEYLYQNSMLPGSGECCLSEILTAGAFAKIPLANRIPNLGSDGSGGMEVHFVYGERDWMDFRGGLEAQQLCHQKREEWERNQEKLKGERKPPSMNLDQMTSSTPGLSDNIQPPPPKVFVHGVKDASHLLMLDNYQEFNAALIIASGGGPKIPPNVPRPVEFACDEVLNSNSSYKSQGNVLGEAEATAFFCGPRWRRGREQTEAPEADDDEEKKMEEQIA